MIGYIATFLSILGNILVVYKKKIGFLIWLASNFVWIYVDIGIGLYSQIVMMVLYAILNVLGWYEWSKNTKLKERK